MKRRPVVCLGLAAAVAIAVSLRTARVDGQAPRAASPNRASPAADRGPRTADGQPDLQGVWDFRTLTPLERPTDLRDKQTLTSEEASTLEQRAAQNRVDRPPRAGDPGTYNQFWFDFGTKIVGDKRTSLIVDPPDGRLPPMTAAGQNRAAAEAERRRRPAAGPEDRPVYERCILGFNSGPPILPSGYNNNVQLFQTRDYVVILTEMVHDARIVPLDGRPHVAAGTRLWIGDSRGHWEGNTLIVDTANFTPKGTGTIGLPVTTDEHLHLVERFTRVAPDTLLYEFTIDDPTVWTRPWSAAVPMTRSREQMYEYACHEGNYGMVGILAGARAQEQAAADAARNKK